MLTPFCPQKLYSTTPASYGVTPALYVKQPTKQKTSQKQNQKPNQITTKPKQTKTNKEKQPKPPDSKSQVEN